MVAFEIFLLLICLAMITACVADVRRERQKRRGLLAGQSVSGPFRGGNRRRS